MTESAAKQTRNEQEPCHRLRVATGVVGKGPLPSLTLRVPSRGDRGGWERTLAYATGTVFFPPRVSCTLPMPPSGPIGFGPGRSRRIMTASLCSRENPAPPWHHAHIHKYKISYHFLTCPKLRLRYRKGLRVMGRVGSFAPRTWFS